MLTTTVTVPAIAIAIATVDWEAIAMQFDGNQTATHAQSSTTTSYYYYCSTKSRLDCERERILSSTMIDLQTNNQTNKQ
jgi:hypothetical protein